MKAVRRSGVVFVAGFAFFAALFSMTSAGLSDQTTVDDETGLMSSAAVAQIDARNRQLFEATGLVVAVVVQKAADAGSAAPGVPAAADKVAKGYYGAVVWVATDGERSDILFTGKALKWVPYSEQTSLQHDLAGTMRYCCPSDTVPGIVDQVAAAMETGAKTPPNSSNYVHDELGLLNGEQTERIVVHNDRLEAATGKGVAVVAFPEQPGSASNVFALRIAQTLNVSGQIAALIWVAKGQNAWHFAMMQTPDFDTIPEATASSIGSSLQADMQTGNFGDAVVAAVDRTATAIEGTSTPMPTRPPLPSEVSSGQASGLPSQVAETPEPQAGSSSAGTAVVVFIVIAIAVLTVMLALRRHNQ